MKILPQSYIICDIDSTVYMRDTNNDGSRKTEIPPDWELEASLGYLVNSRPAWAIKQDSVKKKKKSSEHKFHSYVKVWA